MGAAACPALYEWAARTTRSGLALELGAVPSSSAGIPPRSRDELPRSLPAGMCDDGKSVTTETAERTAAPVSLAATADPPARVSALNVPEPSSAASAHLSSGPAGMSAPTFSRKARRARFRSCLTAPSLAPSRPAMSS